MVGDLKIGLKGVFPIAINLLNIYFSDMLNLIYTFEGAELRVTNSYKRITQFLVLFNFKNLSETHIKHRYLVCNAV